ncbi:MAG: translation elongation factor Ts [Opitutales bacterium]|nr:translation elongation factor Ts [Opitutales bacterium]MDG1326626.1 translation elongation factor Ts [Opitutales bacterium]
MSAISKDDVLNLREKTGAGLIDCKRALVESNGDLDEAISILRKKGVASAAKKAGRDAGEGIVAQCLSEDRSKGILVEVNCETDFVAKNDDFVNFASDVARQLLANPDADLEAQRTEQVAKIGENIRISRSSTLAPNSTGLVESYVHTGGKVAVLLTLGSSSSDAANNENVKSLAKDLCMHIAATSPVCVSREEVPADLVAKEKEIALAQAEGKPPQAIEKIVQGKLDKYFSNSCFLEQPFVKDPDHSIKGLLEKTGKEIGAELSVEKFVRFQVGEEG